MPTTALVQPVLDLAQALGAVASPSGLAEVVADQVGVVLGADSAAVAVRGGDGGHLTVLVPARPGDRELHRRWQHLASTRPSPLADAAGTGSPVVLQRWEDAATAYPAAARALSGTGLETTAYVPLRHEGSVLGVLVAAWEVPEQCTGESLEVTQALAALVAQALARLRRLDQRAWDAQRMAALVNVAAALGEADTETDVLQVLTTHGITALGAQGAGLCLPAPDRATVRVLTSSYFEQELASVLHTLPADCPLPMVHAAVSGTPYFLRDRAAATSLYPDAEQLYARARTEGSAEAPLRAGGVLLGSVSLAFAEAVNWRPEEQALVETLAAMTAQTLQRLRARDAERAATAQVRRLSEGLQRSLLPDLPGPDHLELVARYVPAADEAQVGGDWYDAFMVRDGSTCLVIGDVTGHDSAAAVAMAQVRNVLRGITHAVTDPPAGVLRSLDRAMSDLAVGALATAVLAKIEQGSAEAAGGLRTLRWSNAGHLPPLVLGPDGTAEFLHRPSDLLLGLVAEAERHDHSHQLHPGSTLLLYTDGLVERRGEDLQDGLDRLLAAAQELVDLPLQQLCDTLVQRLVEDDHGAGARDDDVALLAVRAHPEDRSRPAEAGPRRLPADLTAEAPTLAG